jgi:hypothetical protein
MIKLKRLFSRNKRLPAQTDFEPEVSLVISAYNEADFIEKKLGSGLSL